MWNVDSLKLLILFVFLSSRNAAEVLNKLLW